MKTKTIKILICFLFLSTYNVSFAQHLKINGRFLNSEEKSTTALYTLMSDGKIIKTGKSKKIKLALKLNKQYTLIISRDGFKDKTISFDTYTTPEEIFNFYAILKKIPAEEAIKSAVVIVIYYSKRIDNFSYIAL